MKALLITSGKGGTGKTLLASNIAIVLSERMRVALIDADFRAPNLTYVMGIPNKKLDVNKDRLIVPYRFNDRLQVFSTEHYFARDNGLHRAIILPGETVRSMVRQAIKSVAWDSPDIFVIDSDPSTSDVLIALSELFDGDLSALVVTTNDISSIFDCERTIDALMIEGINILGIVGNQIWDNDDHRIVELSKKLNIPYLGYIPYDHRIRLANNEGKPLMPDLNIIRRIVENGCITR
ncbi:MAG: P-loop NTPase [Thermoplasmata archaeon]